MTYNVFGEMLSLTQSINQSISISYYTASLYCGQTGLSSNIQTFNMV